MRRIIEINAGLGLLSTADNSVLVGLSTGVGMVQRWIGKVAGRVEPPGFC